MKPVKFVLLACSALAILIVFALPYISLGEGLSWSLWKLRDVNPRESLIHPYVILGAMALPVVFGALALRTQRLPRWQSIVSALAFVVALLIAFAVFSKTQTEFGDHSGIGAKVMMVALLGGALASIAGAVKPEVA
jgi:hypothetical protein